MRSSTLTAIALALAIPGARAAVITNAETYVVSQPVTLSGVTNIFTHTTLPAQIDADLTLDNLTYLRFKGANVSGTSTNPTDTQPVIKIGTTSEDVRLTIKNKSLFAATYRNSKSPEAWANAGIDPAGNGDAAPSRIRVHLGTPDGAPGSTGCVKIDVQTTPAFGNTAFGSFWAEWLYINSSVKPNASGYIDFLDLASGAIADIAYIDNLSDTPARILFNGGQLFRNNANQHGAPLAVGAGHELILEGVNGNYVEYCKQYQNCDFTARRGGTVRFRGGEVRLKANGGISEQYLKWHLSAADNIVWEHTGQLYLRNICFLVTQDDDVLPHASGNGQIRFHNMPSNLGKAGYVNYCTLDIGSTTQHVNGMVSDSQDARLQGVVSNLAYAAGTSQARGTLVFGEHDFDTVFNARCTAGVKVEKIGKGTLSVKNACGERLSITEGNAVFSDGSAFDALVVGSGCTASGEVSVNTLVTIEESARVFNLNLKLGAEAAVSAASLITLGSLVVDGEEVPAGEYASAPWLAVGSAPVAVLSPSDGSAQDATWTGDGADNLVTTPGNWASLSPVKFSYTATAAQFGQSGTEAVFPGDVSFLASLTFNAPGDFTLSGSNDQNSLVLYGPVNLGGEGTRTYKVDMPLELRGGNKTIVVPNQAGLTLHLRDISGNCNLNIEGEKFSELKYDYATAGKVILENVRTPGSIDHTKGGGTVIFRGEVGMVGDSGTYTLDYGRYRNGSDKTGGWAELGKTRVENVVFRKKFSIGGGGQVDGSTGTSDFLFFAGQTNRFEELVTMNASATVGGERGAVTIFEKGLKNAAGAADLIGRGSSTALSPTAAEPTVFIFNGPVNVSAGDRPLRFSGGNEKVIFRTTGNSARVYLQLSLNATMEFTVDDAFDNTDFYFQSDGVMDLCGTHQKTRRLLSYGNNESAANCGIITSSSPATLEVTSGAPNREMCAWGGGGYPWGGVSTNSTQQFTGPVSLVKSGAGYLLMNRNGPVESTGSVSVNGGTLEFTARASWPNAAAVTAEGTGALVLGGPNAFNRKTELNLTGAGTLSLPENVTMSVETLYLDGSTTPAKAGLYGAVGDTGAKYTTSHILSGRVRVVNLGTRIILR